MVQRVSKSYCLILIAGISCFACDDAMVFEQLSSSHTGIYFSNDIEEDQEYNVRKYMNIYTGAGVSTGDINNDGLTDLYFSGNMVSGRLYLNQGNLNFKDITEDSGIENSRWGTGTVMVDINQDGWTDIYVTVSGSDNDLRERANMLYINNGDNTFTESATKYGVADTRQSMHSAFFDYDRDGDLDLFVIVNPAAYESQVNAALPRKLNGESPSTDVLYRNNNDGSFTDVSRESGILIEGYSLGLAISDINKDQWPDIYISNDFVGNDILYINNGDGTFTNQINKHLKHTSYAGMGNDISDINNDGLADIMVLDMRPSDNKRQKLIISSTGYDRFQLMLDMDYDPQYTRNTLQLNRGGGVFSEVGFMSGVSSTDWSWSSLFADYDNDGDRDLFVTNGFLRDLGNLDYIHYSNIYSNNPMGDAAAKIQEKLENIKSLDGADLKDFVFENNGEASFTDKSASWGIDQKGYSNGALYADLDNDGDLEIVVNNINGAAHIYENKTSGRIGKNFLRINLIGSKGNREGFGSKIIIQNKAGMQYYEHFTSRGYESSIDPVIHFGIGSAESIDEIQIIWPDGNIQVVERVEANQQITLKHTESYTDSIEKVAANSSLTFTEVFHQDLDFIHREDDYVDFKNQPIIPHMQSKGGPGIAVADVNNDGLEDFYVGGATGQSGRLYRQNTDGFTSQKLPLDSASEEMGLLFFDADNDGDQDLYVGNGGSSFLSGTSQYQDKLLINDGTGLFSVLSDALPEMSASSSSVVAGDYDKDGDLDLFVGGRVVPGAYPMPPKSYLLRNDSENEIVRFTDITPEELLEIGMVTSALWTDYDNDGWLDLMLAGEFMPITFFRNEKGAIKGSSFKILDSSGWWNSLVGGDFDQDGDIDYLGGNLGLNSRFRASSEEPLCIYASDYDKNGKIDPVMCYYINGENQLAHTRDDIIKQMNAMRVRFKTYETYANVTFEESFLPEELEAAYLVKSERFQSSYIENLGDGNFAIKDLPWEAQVAPIFGMITDDFDADGYLDVLSVGNFYAAEVSNGRYDASVGAYLKGNGQGEFEYVSLEESGFLADADAKGLARLALPNNEQLILVGNNSASLQVYSSSVSGKSYKAADMDAAMIVTTKDGKTIKQEFYYGSTYLSQSSRSYSLNDNIEKIEVFDFQGTKREVSLNDPKQLTSADQ